jgi:hypothetical protein
MSRGSPKLDVRAPADQQARWKQAAASARVPYSTWVRARLDRAATAELRDCPHPRDEREPKPYGTICGRCGLLVGAR